ncbi:Thioredoxin reductase [Pedobacter westerhofensis]|uniref:Thioredoxin reductase n=1 Tax=Pedobacter westerhofensis TaxID=425512 RepID=A0A521AUZ7_9SPHI|nr:NAD(P)/FAD-dependent oxidoreductase [Pedobacter westerhofensis]SMO38639.1 Thioredoxin reductase [Pedobacter westerhofensis]
MTASKNFEVIIIGGSYAGLSAAMALGRSLRNALIIDSGLPCNRQTPHSHNFLTQDGEQPAVIAAKAKAEVLKYSTVRFLTGTASAATKTGDGFTVTTVEGETFQTKKLIFATGIKDLMPNIKGFAECWGISVVHCPYCHGYELKGQKTGILANGARAVHLASLVYNLTKDLTVFTMGKGDFTANDLEKFKTHNIQIVETVISEIQHENGQLSTLIFDDGSSINYDALYAAVPFIQHSDLPQSLGCELTEQGYISIDNFQSTTVKGIYACGDNCGMMRAVANSVYTGNFAGAMVNKELCDQTYAVSAIAAKTSNS